MKIKKFYQQQDFLDFLNGNKKVLESYKLETAIALRHAQEDNFVLDGYCKVCERPTIFLIDKLYGSREILQGWLPNWRERLVCNHCHLNNRQRAMLHALKMAVACYLAQNKPIDLYVMEQVTPLFSFLNQWKEITCIGSEYLGENLSGGEVINGIRHENAEALSFPDKSIDIIVSNDVLEHVNAPDSAIAEIYRVLKDQGKIFFTVPFHINMSETIRRAELAEDRKLIHFLPPVYHGNPLSEQGSLVFHDFGWDFIERIRAVGFHEVCLCSYWSYFYGYLGQPQYYFYATK